MREESWGSGENRWGGTWRAVERERVKGGNRRRRSDITCVRGGGFQGVRCSRGKRTKREGERKKTWGGKPQNDKTAEFRVRVTNVYYLILYYLYKTHDDLRLKNVSRDSFNEEVRKEEVVKCCFACSSSIEQSVGGRRQ